MKNDLLNFILLASNKVLKLLHQVDTTIVDTYSGHHFNCNIYKKGNNFFNFKKFFWHQTKFLLKKKEKVKFSFFQIV
jgi:hypothetical protein